MAKKLTLGAILSLAGTALLGYKAQHRDGLVDQLRLAHGLGDLLPGGRELSYRTVSLLTTPIRVMKATAPPTRRRPNKKAVK